MARRRDSRGRFARRSYRRSRSRRGGGFFTVGKLLPIAVVGGLAYYFLIAKKSPVVSADTSAETQINTAQQQANIAQIAANIATQAAGQAVQAVQAAVAT